MFQEISWNSYWLCIALIVGVYYLILLVLFRIKGSMLPAGSVKPVWRNEAAIKPAQEIEAPFEPDEPAGTDFLYPAADSEEYPVYVCIDEVNAYFEEARKGKGDKDAIIKALANILAKYPTIKATAYQASLSSIIIAQCAHLCFMHLTDADMDRVWNG